jgi:isopentenyldiphosphate isomerase
MSHHPPIQVVNELDEPVGGMPIAEVYQQGLIHRVIYVVVEDLKGDILLQKRSATIIGDANKWDISVGGHVDEGEDYTTTAQREMYEELGLKNLKLTKLGYDYRQVYVDNHLAKRFVTIFKTQIAHDTPIKFPPEEISAVQWMKVSEIKRLITTKPETVTTSLKQYMKDY